MPQWSRILPLALLLCCLLTVVTLTGFVGPVTGAVNDEPDVHSVNTPYTIGVNDETERQVQSTANDTNSTAIVSANTTIIVELQTDGDAHWTILETFNLSTDSEKAAFRELATSFESDEAQGSNLGFDSFERASELVDAETDREMAVRDGERSATTDRVEDGWGELYVTFTWENFARMENGRMYVDDVLQTREGLWMSGLTEDQHLVIRTPEELGIDDAQAIPQDGELHWYGPATFTEETLQITLIGEGNETIVTPVNGNGGGTSILSLLLAIGGGIAAIVVVVFLVLNRERIDGVVYTDDEDEEETDVGSDTDLLLGTGDDPESDGMAESQETEDDIDEELLSDEERVVRLLERNGGRMKQANIVRETDWSNAKVSQLLSSMEDEGQINKLRIGRENLISFPDEDVTGFDDE